MSSQEIKVLLIEDDPMVQEVNKQFIERVEGFVVIDKASDGQDGIEKVKRLNPDLVILDVYMPKQDGVEVLYQLRKEQQDVDVIVITAANDKETIKKMLQNGAIDFIIKPFKFDRIKKALDNYKSYVTRIESDETVISQKQLDELILKKKHDENTETFNELPKGLNKSTLEQIIYFLKGQKEVKSAEDVAEGIGIARVTARRYLEYLKESNIIELDVKYGGVGRPINRYIMKK